MRHSVLILVLLVSHHVLFSQELKSPYEPAVFTYKNGRIATYEINLNSLLTINKVEVKNQTVPDTVGVVSIVTDSTYFAIIHQPENKQRPHVIIKKMIDGKIELFTTPESSVLDQYYARKDGIYRELREYRRYVNASEFILVKEFRSVLQYLFLDCPKLSSEEVNKVRLNLKSLRPLIRRYNGCFEAASEIVKEGAKTRWFNPSVEFSLLAGYAMRTFQVNHLQNAYKFATTMKTSSPFAGIEFTGRPNKYSKFSVLADLTFQKVSDRSTKVRNVASNYIVKSQVIYDFLQARHNAAIRYQIAQGNTYQIHVGLGGTMNWMSASKSRGTTQSTINTIQLNENSKSIGSGGVSPYRNYATMAVNYRMMEVHYYYVFTTRNYRDWEETSSEHRIAVGLNLSRLKRLR